MPSNKAYWDRVRRIAEAEGLTTKQAQQRLKSYFKDAAPEASRKFHKQYKIHRHDHEVEIFRGRERVTQRQADRAMDMTFYHSMVRRLSAWSGLEIAEVRAYLAQFSNWRDGISPLFHGEEA